MSATFQAERAGLLESGRPYRSGPPADWDYLIRSLAVWGLAFLALICGLIASFSVFGRQREMETLAARTELTARMLSSQIASLEHRQSLGDTTVARIEILAAKVDRGEGLLAVLSESVERNEAQSRNSLAKLDERVSRMDDRISHFELRLTSHEVEEPSLAARRSENGDQTNAAAQSTAPSSIPQTRLKQFSVLRADEGGAWIVAPEGWFHVAIGDSLPGNVKVLTVDKTNNRLIVHTDKGSIYPAQ